MFMVGWASQPFLHLCLPSTTSQAPVLPIPLQSPSPLSLPLPLLPQHKPATSPRPLDCSAVRGTLPEPSWSPQPLSWEEENPSGFPSLPTPPSHHLMAEQEHERVRAFYSSLFSLNLTDADVCQVMCKGLLQVSVCFKTPMKCWALGWPQSSTVPSGVSLAQILPQSGLNPKDRGSSSCQEEGLSWTFCPRRETPVTWGNGT